MKNNKLMAAIVAAAEFASPAKAKEAISHFTVNELTRSTTASRMHIDNTPPPEMVDNIHRLIDHVLDPARRELGRPVYVNSGYRCPELNRAVGGVPKSYHLQGRAADLNTGSLEGNRHLWQILQKLPHVELIWEGGGTWIHVAY
ncbi:MAG: D-Ala-D-Ala carboxypeptidase family metallohydrolase [Muribaculum sp.]|nr:D-Ala-D-Ala carboxypeptidase family metallohydrolase [Muribaculum sp.]